MYGGYDQIFRENKYEVVDILEISKLIRFNIDIGGKVSHLIEVLSHSSEPNTIHLDGDFRIIIPQNYIEEGKGLNEFESYLIQFLKEHATIIEN